MKISDAIKQFLYNKGDVKKSDIVDEFDSWYYNGASHYIGDTLTRMVKSGCVERVKRGVYRLKRINTISKVDGVNYDQLDLFKGVL
jgi:fatty acid-binding protein DegV|tara:strand:- start:10969 stop:11226 length:258 start_codon:yes stop_codon:yes gene_type:complete